MDHRDIILGISGTSCSRFSKIVVRNLSKSLLKKIKRCFLKPNLLENFLKSWSKKKIDILLLPSFIWSGAKICKSYY